MILEIILAFDYQINKKSSGQKENFPIKMYLNIPKLPFSRWPTSEIWKACLEEHMICSQDRIENKD